MTRNVHKQYDNHEWTFTHTWCTIKTENDLRQYGNHMRIFTQSEQSQEYIIQSQENVSTKDMTQSQANHYSNSMQMTQSQYKISTNSMAQLQQVNLVVHNYYRKRPQTVYP